MRTVLYTGSTYWNVGDDFVRDGARVAMNYFIGEHNALFFPFNLPRQNTAPCREENNFVSVRETPPHGIDYIVVPGLAVGHELHDFHCWVNYHNLADKVIYLGGMWENQYAAEHSRPGTIGYQNLNRSPLIVSRTEEMPDHIAKLPQTTTLPCPSLLNGFRCGEDSTGRHITMSIQRADGIVNHLCAPEDMECAINIFRELQRERYRVRMVCHHQSELEYWRYAGIDDVFFSPWHHEYYDVYRHSALTISTRLHACFITNAFGHPAICINKTDRPRAACAVNPHTKWVQDQKVTTKDVDSLIHSKTGPIEEFVNALAGDYRRALFRIKK